MLGEQHEGQLGNGTMADSSTPVPVFQMIQAAGVTTGGFHSCAVLRIGTVQCWGMNEVGQLGNGTTTASSVPVNVSGITTAIAVAAGYKHSCALLQSGTVRCWGDNSYGELGDGNAVLQPEAGAAPAPSHSSIPVTVVGITHRRGRDGIRWLSLVRGSSERFGDNAGGTTSPANSATGPGPRPTPPWPSQASPPPSPSAAATFTRARCSLTGPSGAGG